MYASVFARQMPASASPRDKAKARRPTTENQRLMWHGGVERKGLGGGEWIWEGKVLPIHLNQSVSECSLN